MCETGVITTTPSPHIQIKFKLNIIFTLFVMAIIIIDFFFERCFGGNNYILPSHFNDENIYFHLNES